MDAGVHCTLPARYSTAICEPLTAPWTNSCGVSRHDALAQHAADCDAGPGFLGHVGVASCDGLESVGWVYGFPGDTQWCFYGADGGGLQGVLTLSDQGVLAAGHVADCIEQAADSCRDGG
jgi:hypothetical protein